MWPATVLSLFFPFPFPYIIASDSLVDNTTASLEILQKVCNFFTLMVGDRLWVIHVDHCSVNRFLEL